MVELTEILVQKHYSSKTQYFPTLKDERKLNSILAATKSKNQNCSPEDHFSRITNKKLLMTSIRKTFWVLWIQGK